MPRPRTPTESSKKFSAFVDQPRRRRPPAPRPPGPVGDPPPELAPEAAACWRGAVSEATPGVLTAADRGTVELVAVIRAQTRQSVATTAEVAIMPGR
jgi:hypothetical protein